jgi:hypothetical protein
MMRIIGWVIIRSKTGELQSDRRIYKSEKGALIALTHWPGITDGVPTPIYIEE